MPDNKRAIELIDVALSELDNSLYTRKSQNVKNQYQENAVRHLKEVSSMLKDSSTEEIIKEIKNMMKDAYESFKAATNEGDRRYNHGAIDAFNNVIESLEENV